MRSSRTTLLSAAAVAATATLGTVALSPPASAAGFVADSHITCITYEWWESVLFFDGVAGTCTTITSTGPNIVEEFDWNGNYWTVS